MAQQKRVYTSFSHSHLDIEGCESSKYYQSLAEYIYSMVALVQFTNLYINFHSFSISILIAFLRLLPNLNSLTVKSIFPKEKEVLSEE